MNRGPIPLPGIDQSRSLDLQLTPKIVEVLSLSKSGIASVPKQCCSNIFPRFLFGLYFRCSPPQLPTSKLCCRLAIHTAPP